MPIEKYNTRAQTIDSLLCVGLDADFDKLPERFRQMKNPQFEFNIWIIEQTHEYAAAFKSNIAFYEARGSQGIQELKQTMEYLQEKHPEIYTICDCKRADIGNTNNGYVTSLFDWFGFDAITINPYLGREAVQPFLDRKNKGCIILCRTSNPGAGELQDLVVNKKPIWQIIAEKVRDEWNGNNNCLLVVGATIPAEMEKIRALVGDMTFLVPGVGAQGGSVQDVLRAGRNSQGLGVIINSSRGIIFADSPQKEAQKLRDEIRHSQ